MRFDAKISLEPHRVIGEVHDHLYGANLEHIGQSVYGGHWAELLKDRKFAGFDRMYLGLSEGLHNQHPGFGVVIPWEPVNPDYARVLFVHDNTTFYTGTQSQRITVREDDGQPHGIRQAGLYLRAGVGCEVRLVLQGEGQPVTVRLGDADWVIPAVPRDWTRFTRVLHPSPNPNGALSITFHGPGSLWVGCASVMPADHLDGHRRDVVEALREWGPTFLRWPGGNFVSAYHWTDGVGDRDRRPTRFDPVWSLLEPNDVGTDEFIDLCRLLACEPILTVNMGDGTPDEAAAWVEYCNGSESTANGARRVANGYREPHNVRTWFVGNEQFGNWQVGHCDAETYARRYLEFARAMRAVDPALNLIGVGVPADLYGRWNELVLQAAGEAMDEFSVHYYSIRTEKWDQPPPAEQIYLPKIAAAHEVTEMLDRTLELVAQFSEPAVPVAFDEWNTYVGAKAPGYVEDYNLADALYTGAVMNACLRRCDRVKMSAIYNLINVMGSYRVTPEYRWEKPAGTRVAYWSPRTDDDRNTWAVWKMPATLVMALMTRHRGRLGIGCTVETPTFASPESGNLPAYDAVPLVDAAATFDPDAGVVYVSMVNRDTQRTARVILAGITPNGVGRIYRVTDPDPLATNTVDAPDRIGMAEAVWSGDDLTLPPTSFTLLAVPVAVS